MMNGINWFNWLHIYIYVIYLSIYLFIYLSIYLYIYIFFFFRAHKSTRCLVERGIGHLKRRFHVLHGEIRLSPQKTCKVILACGLIYNICKKRNILHGEEEEKAIEDDNVLPLPEVDVVVGMEGVPQNGLRYRDHFTNINFQWVDISKASSIWYHIHNT